MQLRVAIIGVGLIGGSIGLALKGSARVQEIIGIDTDRRALEMAVEIGAIDRAAGLEEGVRAANVVFICTPLGTFPHVVRSIRDHLRPGCIVTDVGSTKQMVMDTFEQELPAGVHWIGGHPMAGSERAGVSAADRYLFENAVYVLTPRQSPDQPPVKIMLELVAEMGARAILMNPAEHDELVAVISHVPHLVAVALVNQAARESKALMLAAGGFRDTTRVASSNPGMWGDILFCNRKAVIKKLDDFNDILSEIHASLTGADWQGLRDRLEKARETRDSIPLRRKGLIPDVYDVITIVPDQPGIIGHLGSVLGEKDINIVDIEILRVREGDGGTLRLGVPSLEEAENAVDLLRAKGIKAWLR